MTVNNGTLDKYQCSDGLLVPFINEFTWPLEARAFLYLIGLLYCFMGVAIIADIFMGSIEKITSTTRKVYLSRGDNEEAEVIEVRIWNDTVANLTLMALGSSAPEILLSIIEVVSRNFEAGELGPGAIVGSAAFNLLSISAVCVASIPLGETRHIKGVAVFGVTTFFSIFAYLWLIIVLLVWTPGQVSVAEAWLTLLMFPLLVGISYAADRGLPFCNNSQVAADDADGKQIELGPISPVEPLTDEDALNLHLVDGQVDPKQLARYLRTTAKLGLSGEDSAKLAAYKLMTTQHHSRIWYRIGAIRNITGSKKTQPQLSIKLKEVYDAINENPDAPNLPNLSEDTVPDKAVVEFHAIACAVPENVGKFPITIIRHGKTDIATSVRIESIDGSAVAAEDYIAIDQVVDFDVGEMEKQIHVEIVDDNQYEPDEQFYLKLSLVGGPQKNPDMLLGRISIMEVTILNDDDPGALTFEERGILVKESVGSTQIPVLRRNGADGEVSVRWRTIDKSAHDGHDFQGGEGILVFKHAETKLFIEIPIINDMVPEKDECFEVELFDPSGGAALGTITKMAITITNDEEFNSVLNRMAELTTANVDSMTVHHETWISQIKDAMNVNGGDIENATTTDYVMHFCTFGWKIIFALVPPAGILGGWLTFFVSMFVIGFITAIISDFASLFGCLIGMPDSVTAITIVALGTSLPDLFASKAAACQEKHADNAIGNITGSNSVNVFLGLGLPWVIASMYHASKGTSFKVPPGSLAFSITVFTVVAILAFILFGVRRNLSFFGRAELGGPKVPKIASAAVLVVLWFLYIAFSVLESSGIIPGFPKPNSS